MCMTLLTSYNPTTCATEYSLVVSRAACVHDPAVSALQVPYFLSASQAHGRPLQDFYEAAHRDLPMAFCYPNDMVLAFPFRVA